MKIQDRPFVVPSGLRDVLHRDLLSTGNLRARQSGNDFFFSFFLFYIVRTDLAFDSHTVRQLLSGKTVIR